MRLLKRKREWHISLIATIEVEPGLLILDLDFMITWQAPIATIEKEPGVTHFSYCDNWSGTVIVNFRFMITGQAPIATIEMEPGVTHVFYCDHWNGTGIVNFITAKYGMYKYFDFMITWHTRIATIEMEPKLTHAIYCEIKLCHTKWNVDSLWFETGSYCNHWNRTALDKCLLMRLQLFHCKNLYCTKFLNGCIITVLWRNLIDSDIHYSGLFFKWILHWIQ
jgi:hypothetical protein